MRKPHISTNYSEALSWLIEAFILFALKMRDLWIIYLLNHLFICIWDIKSNNITGKLYYIFATSHLKICNKTTSRSPERTYSHFYLKTSRVLQQKHCQNAFLNSSNVSFCCSHSVQIIYARLDNSIPVKSMLWE